MNLRSGTHYRSGHQSGGENQSRASTLGSTARTPANSTQVEEPSEGDSLSDSSMATSSTIPPTGLDLEYDGRLRFTKENEHGGLIYKDFINRYVVKIEDHVTPFDPSPWVNFQGDRYMGKDGSMYMLTEFPEEVDKLGNLVVPEIKVDDEGPPKVNLPNFKLVNSVWVHRVLIDDMTKVLYQRNDGETEFFYLRSQIPEHMAPPVKVLYVYVRTPVTEEQNILMLDKFGFEWELLLPVDVKDMKLTRMGVPVVGGNMGVSFGSPIVPPASTVRPKVSFVEPIASMSGIGGGFRPTGSLGGGFGPAGSMGGSSGHPAD